MSLFVYILIIMFLTLHDINRNWKINTNALKWYSVYSRFVSFEFSFQHVKLSQNTLKSYIVHSSLLPFKVSFHHVKSPKYGKKNFEWSPLFINHCVLESLWHK
jgi:hypothetical protein